MCVIIIPIPDTLHISELSFLNSTALVCISTGRPVSSVTWTIDEQEIDFATNTSFAGSQVLSDPLRAEYLNILVGQEDSVFTGSVSCQVTDADAGTVRRTLTLNGKLHQQYIIYSGILYPSYS